ncbi:MAG: hypothetical protein Q8M24_06935 [Pseudolabrys sp.]|nr:hypothetical protein [Pseudolabrys sp.]MDP2295185.1 hypothetical protein [Pseudolabrys sp.]
MNIESFATEANIRRFQNLLETSVDDSERQVLQKLLAEEQAKSEMRASVADRQ